MLFKNLSYEKFKTDAFAFHINKDDSYIESYEYFLQYFSEINVIEKSHLIIAAHFVYGWMPTVLNLNTQRVEEVLIILNKAKNGYLINEADLLVLKSCVNNSIVGSSKLLHFINPSLYGIFDSRVYRYLTNNKSSFGIDKPARYLAYLNALSNISCQAGYEDIHSHIENYFNYKLSPYRAIELVMFETDRRSV